MSVLIILLVRAALTDYPKLGDGLEDRKVQQQGAVMCFLS